MGKTGVACIGSAGGHGSQPMHLAQIARQIVGNRKQFCIHPAALKQQVAC